MQTQKQKPAAMARSTKQATKKATKTKAKAPTDLPLVVALDAEASAVVRGWAKILKRDPRDVVSGMLLYVPEASLERYREYERKGMSLEQEEFTDAAELVSAAAERRKKLADNCSAPGHSDEVILATSREVAYELRNFAYYVGNCSPEDIAAAMIETEVRCCTEDPSVLLTYIREAQERWRARQQ
jgi:hypothetical protein